MLENELRFSALEDPDVEQAYSILTSRVYDLKNKGIHQYQEPYPPIEMFRERQKEGFNFALYDGKQLAAIVALIPDYLPEGWSEFPLPKQNFIWLTSLFSSLEYQGNHLGKIMLQKTEEYLPAQQISILLLDCYINEEEFLVKYYRRFGFKEVLRKKVVYPGVNTFSAALMMKSL